jgi:hypothetical protein
MSETEASAFSRYFTLEEAVDMLPDIRFSLAEAHREMAGLQDDLILNKRLLLARQRSRRRPSEEEVQLLKQKVERFEAAYRRWEEHFFKQGVLLRDLASGLVDFPYRAESDGQDYFLCWKPPEEGIFYFHSLHDGFAGRHPITLLPD